MSKPGKYDDGTLYNLHVFEKNINAHGNRREEYKEAITFPELLSYKIHYEKLGFKVRWVTSSFGDGTYE